MRCEDQRGRGSGEWDGDLKAGAERGRGGPVVLLQAGAEAQHFSSKCFFPEWLHRRVDVGKGT